MMGKSHANGKVVYALIDYGDDYVQPLLQQLLNGRAWKDIRIHQIASLDALPESTAPCLFWAQYETLPFEHAHSHPTTCLINSYIFRKALIRKHYLATVVRNALVKQQDSILGRTVKPSVDFEVDYAEFLDDALVECYELNEVMARNEERDAADREWWILKAGMAERGGGIRLFSSMSELQKIFEAWDPESDGEGDDAVLSSDEAEGDDEDDGIVTSQMRHFIAQPYIDRPLLLAEPFESAGRKWHIRTYVLAVGSVKVYVYRNMLALFAGQPYFHPSDGTDPNEDLSGHLSNTCLQNGERQGSVHEYWSLPSESAKLPETWKDSVYKQICETTGSLFEAAARGMSVHFQPLLNGFELYGLDFMVDDEGKAWLLEVNAFPDFAQTGSDLQSLIEGLFRGTFDIAVEPFFDTSKSDRQIPKDFTRVLDIDLGRR